MQVALRASGLRQPLREPVEINQFLIDLAGADDGEAAAEDQSLRHQQP